MRNAIQTLTVPVFVLLVLVNGAMLAPSQEPAEKPSVAQQQTPDPPKGAALKPDADMEAAMAAMMPGPVHERLAKFAGDWTVKSKMQVAGQPDMESEGTATIRSELGGRFLHETGAGNDMGMPTQHFRMWGYNNGSRKYEAVWTWTFSTGFLNMLGDSKDDGKTIDWDAWYANESGEKEEFKIQTTFIDDDHFTVRIYGGKMPDGSPGPTMMTEYARKK